MSGIDEITHRLTSVCTGLSASVWAVMDEKLSGKVGNGKMYEVVSFIFFSLTLKRTNCNSEDDSLRFSFVQDIWGILWYIWWKVWYRKLILRENRTAVKSTSGWMNWMARTNDCAVYLNPKRVGQQRVRQWSTWTNRDDWYTVIKMYWPVRTILNSSKVSWTSIYE